MRVKLKTKKTKQQKKIPSLEQREGLTNQAAVDVAGHSAESIQGIPPPPLPIQQMQLPTKDFTRVY